MFKCFISLSIKETYDLDYEKSNLDYSVEHQPCTESQLILIASDPDQGATTPIKSESHSVL